MVKYHSLARLDHAEVRQELGLGEFQLVCYRRDPVFADEQRGRRVATRLAVEHSDYGVDRRKLVRLFFELQAHDIAGYSVRRLYRSSRFAAAVSSSASSRQTTRSSSPTPSVWTRSGSTRSAR